MILGDSEGDPFGDSGNLGSDTIVKAFSDAIDDRVRAIIFRIDSPGGSYVAADAIWREVMRAREMGIPVIASFGSAGGVRRLFRRRARHQDRRRSRAPSPARSACSPASRC